MIFDAHMHMGSHPNYFLPEQGNLESVIHRMNVFGIDYGMQMHMSGFLNLNKYAHDHSIRIFEESMGRIFFGLIFDPINQEESIKWIKRAEVHPGCVCIKIHPSMHQTYADDPNYKIVWEIARDLGLPIVSHTWAMSNYNPTQKFSTPDHFVNYLEKFPEVDLVMGHGGGRYEGHLAALKIAEDYKNVYLDTSGDVNAYGLLHLQVDRLGAERILFGSDVNMIDTSATIGKVFACDISMDKKLLILGENALKLFNIKI